MIANAIASAVALLTRAYSPRVGQFISAALSERGKRQQAKLRVHVNFVLAGPPNRL